MCIRDRVSYVQNEMQSKLNAFCDTMSTLLEGTNLKLVGSYEHLPIMQFILLERYDVVKKKAEALRALISVGVPKEDALDMAGFDKGMELGEMLNIGNNGNEQNGSSSNSSGNQAGEGDGGED